MQARAHDARLVDRKHVARAQQRRKIRERAMIQPVTRSDDEQPRLVTPRGRLARDQRVRDVVVVRGGRARAVRIQRG
jgi:hypothetical protein